MLVTLKEVLSDAKKNKYGVGLFNTVNLEMARGVIAAAEEAKSPVIIGTAEVLLPFGPLDELASLIVPMAKKASVPVVVHFDHGMTPELIEKSMRLGFSSVMYDCSTATYEENIKNCSNMVNIAKKYGCSVEAELGHVGSNEHSAEGDSGDSIYTNPLQAKEFAALTEVDALAVAIGTAHGAYVKKPILDLDRLKEISSIVSTPLVLHGGSGLSNDDFRNCIANGIAKINIFTDINVAAAKAATKAYNTNLGFTDLTLDIIEAIKQATLTKMMVFGSCNRA